MKIFDKKPVDKKEILDHTMIFASLNNSKVQTEYSIKSCYSKFEAAQKETQPIQIKE